MTKPIACMNAYTVVGPTNRQPRRLRSLASARDCASALPPRRGSTAPRPALRLEPPHVRGQRPLRSTSSTARRALLITASILPRWRTIDASPSSRADVALVEPRHHLEVEARERPPEVLALAQDRQPRQPGLKALEAQLLEQADVVGDREAPLAVVVGPVVRRRGPPVRPPAADETPSLAARAMPRSMTPASH